MCIRDRVMIVGLVKVVVVVVVVAVVDVVVVVLVVISVWVKWTRHSSPRPTCCSAGEAVPSEILR